MEGSRAILSLQIRIHLELTQNEFQHLGLLPENRLVRKETPIPYRFHLGPIGNKQFCGCDVRGASHHTEWILHEPGLLVHIGSIFQKEFHDVQMPLRTRQTQCGVGIGRGRIRVNPGLQESRHFCLIAGPGCYQESLLGMIYLAKEARVGVLVPTSSSIAYGGDHPQGILHGNEFAFQRLRQIDLALKVGPHSGQPPIFVLGNARKVSGLVVRRVVANQDIVDEQSNAFPCFGDSDKVMHFPI